MIVFGWNFPITDQNFVINELIVFRHGQNNTLYKISLETKLNLSDLDLKKTLVINVNLLNVTKIAITLL